MGPLSSLALRVGMCELGIKGAILAVSLRCGSASGEVRVIFAAVDFRTVPSKCARVRVTCWVVTYMAVYG